MNGIIKAQDGVVWLALHSYITLAHYCAQCHHWSLTLVLRSGALRLSVAYLCLVGLLVRLKLTYAILLSFLASHINRERREYLQTSQHITNSFLSLLWGALLVMC